MDKLSVQPGDIWLSCEDQAWFGWKSLSVKSSLSQVQHSFEMKTTDIQGLGEAQWNVEGGSEVSIYFRNVRIFTGYVQKYDISLSDTSHKISIAGESKAIDLVQCSHVGKYFWKNVSGESIIKEVVKPFGLDIRIDAKLAAIPKEGLRVPVDSTAFDVIKKVAEQSSVLIYTMQSGTIRIADDPSQDQVFELKPGDYKSISVNTDYSTIFSEVILKSQEKTYKTKEFKKRQQKEQVKKNKKGKKKKPQKTEQQPKITTIDTQTNTQELRYRPLVVISDGKEDSQKKLIENVNRRLNGDGKKISLTVKTPYTPTGEIWGIGQYVVLKDDIMGIDGSYIISDVSFSLSDSGFETQLDLCLPHVFNLKEVTPAQKRSEAASIFYDLMGIF